MKSLKSTLTAVAFLVAASPVFAADVYQGDSDLSDTGGYYDKQSNLPAIVWAGFYVGANLGTGTSDDSSDWDNGNGGVQLGYHWQNGGPLVIGLEGDVGEIGGEGDLLGSIRGRVGYGFDNALLYGLGGAAFLQEDEGDKTEGYLVGGGLDYKITSGTSLGIEANYYDFDKNIDASNFWTLGARLNFHLTRQSPETLK